MQPLQDFPSMFVVSVTFPQLLLGLAAAFVSGSLIGFVYRHTTPGVRASGARSRPLVIFAMVSALVLMVIGNNLARAFGLVGAVSVIRFRMAVKDVRDIVFIFFALGAGMGAGIGAYALTIFGSLFICSVLYIITITGFGTNPKRIHLLECRVTGDAGEAVLTDAVERFTTHADLATIKAAGAPGITEVSYNLRLERPEDAQALVAELETSPDISDINLFSKDT